MSFRFRVRDLMTSDVKTLGRNDELSIADDVMRMERIRHLPVLDEETSELAGILSQRDLFRGALAGALGYGEHAQRSILASLLVKDVMTTEVHTVEVEAHVREAARLMLEHKVGCVVVVDPSKSGRDRLVGIVSESDFVRLFARDDD